MNITRDHLGRKSYCIHMKSCASSSSSSGENAQILRPRHSTFKFPSDLIETISKAMLGSESDTNGGYGLSKACLAAYTMLCAKVTPSICFSCCSPGFIETKMTSGFGATKTPDQGTLAIKKCLLEPLAGNGWYYGSDGLRSPYHCACLELGLATTLSHDPEARP